MKRKKIYIAPQIDQFLIDNEISLIMMTYNNDTQPPDGPFGAQEAPPATEETPMQQSSFEQNPFSE